MRKPLVAILPLLLILSLVAVPSTSAQVTYIISPEDTTITHDGEDYILTELVGGQTCKIYYNGAESGVLVVGGTIGNLAVIKIADAYVVLEGEQAPAEDEVEDEEPPVPVAEKRYTLESGDILLFSDSDGVNGAMAYVFGEAMNPTFLFWTGGRLPTISKTPTPNENGSLSSGQAFASDAVGGLTARVESVNGDEVVVVCETDDSISLMKTTVGGSDVSDIVEQLKLWVQSQQPPVTQPSPSVDLTGITVVALIAVAGFLFNEFYWKPHRTWGQGL